MVSSFHFGSADNGESLDISLFLCLDSLLVPFAVAGEQKVGINGREQCASRGSVVEMAIRGCPAYFQVRRRYPFRTVAFSVGPIHVSFKGTHPSAKAKKYYQLHSEYSVSSSTPSAPTSTHRRTFHTGQMPALERKWNEHTC